MNNTHHPDQGVRGISEKGNREIEAFIRNMRNEYDWKPTTARKYRETLGQFYAETSLETVQKATIDHIYTYKGWMKARDGNKKPYEPSSIYRRIDYIKTYLKHNNREDLVKAIRNPKPPAKLYFRPSFEEVTRIYEYANSYPASRQTLETRALYKALISTNFYCGLRCGELQSLKWDDVDTEKKEVSIRDTKFGKSRTVPMGDQVIKDLDEYRRLRSPHPSNRIFLSLHHNPITQKTINRIFKKCALGAEIEQKVTSHSFRRACAKYLHKNGMPLVDIQVFLGHTKIETTVGYVGVDEEEMKEKYREVMPSSFAANRDQEDSKAALKKLAQMRVNNQIEYQEYVLLRADLTQKLGVTQHDPSYM